MFALVNIKVRDCICDGKCLFEIFRLKLSFGIGKMALTKILEFIFVLPAKCILCVEVMNRLYIWDIWNFHVS